MPPSLDPKLMWLVTISGVEGISIAQLFEQIEKDTSIGPLNEEQKTELWEELLRNDVYVIGDAKAHTLMLRKNLGLEDVYELGVQDRKVRLRADVANGHVFASASTSSPATPSPAPVAQQTSNSQGPESSKPSTPVPDSTSQITPNGQTTKIRKKKQIPHPSENAVSTPRIRKPVQHFDPATHKDPPGNNPKYLRQSKFTPYEELVREEENRQRRAGISRVYIDPYTEDAPKDGSRTRSKKPKLIALFKSEKLKDPQWLPSQARVWEISETVEQVEEPRPKRKWTRRKGVATDTLESSPAPVNAGSSQTNVPDEVDPTQSKPPPKKRGRPRKIRPGDVEVSSATNTDARPVPSVALGDIKVTLPSITTTAEDSISVAAPVTETSTPLPTQPTLTSHETSIINFASSTAVSVPSNLSAQALSNPHGISSSYAVPAATLPAISLTQGPPIPMSAPTISATTPAVAQQIPTNSGMASIPPLLQQGGEPAQMNPYVSISNPLLPTGSTSLPSHPLYQGAQPAQSSQYTSPYATSNKPVIPVTPAIRSSSYSSPYASPYSQVPLSNQPAPQNNTERKRKATDPIAPEPKRVQVESSFAAREPPFQTPLPNVNSTSQLVNPTSHLEHISTPPSQLLRSFPQIPQHGHEESTMIVAQSATSQPLSVSQKPSALPVLQESGTVQNEGVVSSFQPSHSSTSQVVPLAMSAPTALQTSEQAPTGNNIALEASAPVNPAPTIPSLVSAPVSSPVLNPAQNDTIVPVQEKNTSPAKTSTILDPASHQAVLDRLKEREKQESDLQTALQNANSIEILDCAARVSVKYQDVIGNLVLSNDQSMLNFSGNQQEPSESPLLSIPISSLTEYPILSSKGSNPMELFAYVRDDKGIDITYRFNFGRDPKAFDQANNMRAKLCQAWVVHVKVNGTSQPSNAMVTKEVKEALPFFCPNEGCGRRWKNREGMIYHYARSQTTCNKDWVPPTAEELAMTPQKPRGRKPKSQKNTPVKRRTSAGSPAEDSGTENGVGEAPTEDTPGKTSAVDEDFTPDLNGQDLEVDEADYESSSTDDSLQSIIDYALKSTAPKPPTMSKRRKPSDIVANKEALQAIVDEAATIEISEEPSNTIRDVSPTNAFSNITDVEQLAKEIIVSLVKDNYGMFPGDKSLWYAVFTTSLKKAARSRLIITADICNDALITLLNEGTLRRTRIKFRDEDFMLINRSIVSESFVDIRSPAFTKLQEMIKEVHPEPYIPSKFAPEASLLNTLRGVPRTVAVQRYVPKERQNKWRELSTKKRGKSKAMSISSFENAPDDDVAAGDVDVGDSEVDDIYDMVVEMGTAKDKPEPPKADQPRTTKQPRPDSVSTSVSRTRRRDPNHVRVPLTPEQKAQRALRIAISQQSWSQPAPFLQSSESGAWVETPEIVKEQRKPRTFQRRHLPEPITYMQDFDGAWSIRPFGHGVRPIFCRPSRQTVGNPMLPNYLKRRDNGFRPVIIPEGKRRFLPGLPSKFIMESLKASEGLKSEHSSISRSPTPATPNDAEYSPAPLENVVDTNEKDPDFTPRVSKATGKPVRIYKRKISTLRSESAISVERNVPSSPVVRSRRARRVSSYAIAMEPMEISETASPKIDTPPLVANKTNPGLETLPSSFGLGITGASAETSAMRRPSNVNILLSNRINYLAKATSILSVPLLTDIERTAKWEQEIASDFFTGGMAATNDGWINHTLTNLDCAFGTESTFLKWEEDNAYTMRTLPYEDLANENIPEYMEDLVDVPNKPRYRISENDIHPASLKARQNRERQEKHKTRSVTVLESIFDDIADDPNAAAKELGLQVVPLNAIAPKGKKVREISKADENRLMVAVVVVRVISGGFEMIIDWFLVAMVMKEFTNTFITRRWATLLQQNKDLIEKLTANFQDAFLPAYESGEVAPIDFNNLPAYDWAGLVDWTLGKFSHMFGRQVFKLPDSRETFSKEFVYSEKEVVNRGREDFYSRAPSFATRLHGVASYPSSVPAVPPPQSTPADEMELDEFHIAKSLVRAAALTPDAAWDKDAAKRKLEALKPAHIEEAIATLRKDKVIVKRKGTSNVPSRQYETAVAYLKTELVKMVRDQQVLEAVQFKRFLDEQFYSGKQCVRAEYKSTEGSLMCLTQLQAHGRIRLQGVDIPNNKFGFTIGDTYVTKQIPHQTWLFQVDIYPTGTYIFDSDVDILQDMAFIQPPRGGRAGEIPVWYGITDQLIEPIWAKVIVAISGTISLRTGSTFDTLKEVFKTTIEVWEIQRLLEWGEHVGIFRRLHEDVEGWAVTEWWWAMAGRFCELVVT